MTRRWALAAVAVLGAGVCGVVAMSRAYHPAAAARAPAANTEKVEKGALSALVSGAGTVSYRARSDGSPYVVVNQADGVYTQLPEAGDKVGCGGVLYRVDNRPILLLCGTVPAYRALHVGVGARTSASSTATCTSSATTPTPTSASTRATTPSRPGRSRRSSCSRARRALA